MEVSKSAPQSVGRSKTGVALQSVGPSKTLAARQGAGSAAAVPLVCRGYLRIDDRAGVTLAAEVAWSVVEPPATWLGGVILAVVGAGGAPAKPGFARRSFRAEVWGLVFGVLPLIGAGLFGRLLTCIFG